ncbi:MAG: helix-turn-helix domain-containing protein [Pseudomonadota bacterium]
MKVKRTLSDPLMALKMLLLCEDLTLAERRVGAALLDHRNHRTGRCDPGLETLSRELCIGRRTVIRANAGLEKKGLLRKRRHGGHFHRNGYEFNWERFRDLHAAWERHRESVRRKHSRENLSPCGRQTNHLDGDNETTQTCLSNQSQETYVAAQPQQHTRRDHLPEPSKRTGEVTRSGYAKSVVEERFHVKSTNSRDAAYDAAEARWNNSLMMQLRAAPEVFAPLIELIDLNLQRTTTETELRKPGSGLPSLLKELDQRVLLKGRSNAPAATNSTVPSDDLTLAGNSDREGSPAPSGFESLNSTKHQPKHGA